MLKKVYREKKKQPRHYREDGFSSPGKSLDESMTDFALSKYLEISLEGCFWV